MRCVVGGWSVAPTLVRTMGEAFGSPATLALMPCAPDPLSRLETPEKPFRHSRCRQKLQDWFLLALPF